MTLNTKRSKVPHILLTIPEFQILMVFFFALRPAVLKFEAILNEVHRMTHSPKWPLTRWGQSSLCTCYNLHPSHPTPPPPHSQISLYGQPVSSYHPLRQVHWMIPKCPYTPWDQRYLMYCTAPPLPHTIHPNPTPPNPKFRSMASLFQITVEWDKYTEWPLITLNAKRSKIPHIHVTTTPESQISPCFALRVAILELQAIFRQVHWMTPNDLEH